MLLLLLVVGCWLLVVGCWLLESSKSCPKTLSLLNTFDLEMWFAPQWRALFFFDIGWPSGSSKKWSVHQVFCHFLLPKCASRHNGVHFFDIATSTSQKWSETPHVLTLFTSNLCASRHNGVHFFDIATSKSGPRMTCFDTFYFKMCFAPQRRALFSTSHLPKVVRDMVCFATFDFKMCFAPQTACTFFNISTSKSCLGA